MNKELEMEITKSAFFLEETIRNLENEDNTLRRNKPREPMPPSEPCLEETTVEALPYPLINADEDLPKSSWKLGAIVAGSGFLLSFIGAFSFSAIGSILSTLGGLCIPAGIILIIVMVRKRSKLKAARIEQIQNSAEYKRSCAEIDEQNKQRQAQLDNELHNQYMQRYEAYKKSFQQYEENINHYNNTVIPEWEEELEILETALNNSKDALKELYDRNIIPMKYRNHSAVLWLATYINTSQSNLEEAIRRFDSDVMIKLNEQSVNLAKAQLMVAQEQLQNQQYANWLNEVQAELMQEGNRTLKSISNWQAVDVSVRMYDRHQAQKKRR